MLRVRQTENRGMRAPTDPAAPRANEQTPSASGPKWLDRMRQALRSRHYARQTERTYCHWAKPGRAVPNRCAVHTLRDYWHPAGVMPNRCLEFPQENPATVLTTACS